MSFRNMLSLTCVLVCGVALLAPQPAGAITSTWVLQDANGTWNNPDNWDNGVPKNPGDIAIITNNVAITAAHTITIDTAVSLKALKFCVPGTANGMTVQLGSGGTLTLDSGGAGNSVVQQMKGSMRCKVDAAMVLSNDLDIINSGTQTYFDLTKPISGNFNLHINPDGSGYQPYLTAANTFIGNTTVYAGKLLLGADCFGNTASGTRVVTLVSNSYLRVNYGASPITLSTNRQIVAGPGGGNLDGNGRIVILNAEDQFVGSNSFSLLSQNTAAGGLQLNAANNQFTAPLLVNTVQTLRFGANGSLSNAPLISLVNTSAIFDVVGKTAGYSMPSNQVLAGVGVVSGLVNVASSASVLHPGSYALPGPATAPGILTLAGGLAVTNGGTYAWGLKKLTDNAEAPGTSTYSQLSVTGGGVNLDGGKLMIRFIGIDTPSSTNAFWKTDHVWTILTAPAPPVGKLDVVSGVYGNGAFATRANGNTLELVYARRRGLLISVL